MTADSSKVGAFDEYVAARWARLVRFAVLVGADVHSAEDAVQTALARCYLAWNRVTRASNPDAYVHRVLINTLNETLRRRSSSERPTGVMPDIPSPDRAAEVDEHQAMRDALLTLPIPQRQVIV